MMWFVVHFPRVIFKQHHPVQAQDGLLWVCGGTVWPKEVPSTERDGQIGNHGQNLEVTYNGTKSSPPPLRASAQDKLYMWMRCEPGDGNGTKKLSPNKVKARTHQSLVWDGTL